jgi:hypothetical protein
MAASQRKQQTARTVRHVQSQAKVDTFAPPRKSAKGLQHTQIGQLRGKPLGVFNSAKQLGIAGDELRRATSNHYLFSLQEEGKWRLLDGDVNELPLRSNMPTTCMAAVTRQTQHSCSMTEAIGVRA